MDAHQSDCVFCAIVAGTAEASIVAASEQSLAFLDLRQAQPGHVLVVPRRHAETVLDITPEQAADVMTLALRVAHALQVTFQPDGMNLWQSNFEAGGQEVPHFHLHVHPREMGDGLFQVYPDGLPTHAARADLDKMAAMLRAALDDISEPRM